MADHIHKLILVGDGGVGKTTYINRLYTGEFRKQYIATMGVDTTPLGFHANKGNIVFNICDFAGQEKYGDLLKIIDEHKIARKNHVKGIDVLKDYTHVDLVNMISSYHDKEEISGATCAIVMFDVTSRLSYNSVLSWISVIRNKIPKIPIILCGNKVDVPNRTVLPNDITVHRSLGLRYYDISAKSNYNFEKPFLALAQYFHGKDTKFIQHPQTT